MKFIGAVLNMADAHTLRKYGDKPAAAETDLTARSKPKGSARPAGTAAISEAASSA
jgi:hypothetical protein